MARRRKKRQEPKLPDVDTIEPTVERMQHDTIERSRQSRGARTGDKPPLRVVSENQLSMLLHRRSITLGQHDAGVRLYHEWQASGAEPRVTGEYEMTIRGHPTMSDTQADFAAFVRDALRDVGSVAAMVLVEVCCWNVSPREWARKRGHLDKAGIIFLREALGALQHHYRQREKGR
jgi:hypothetical protein